MLFSVLAGFHGLLMERIASHILTKIKQKQSLSSCKGGVHPENQAMLFRTFAVYIKLKRMQFDSETFASTDGNGPDWSENFYRYCNFHAISTEGAMVHAFFLGCEFSKCDWYWGHFGQAVFVNVKFSGCKFRGCFFADCKFVECEFEDCSFTADNLGADCTFKENRWFDCRQTNCMGIENVFKNTL